MQKTGKISVIVPVYKAEKYIERCVRSLTEQTYKNLEIILVDDGSPDNCGKICDDFAALDERIKVIHKKNGGVSSARNAGLSAADGEYIQFVDSDDYTEPEMCEMLINSIIKEQSDFIICGYKNLSQDGLDEVLPFIEKTAEVSDFIKEFPSLYKSVLLNSPWNKLYIKKNITFGFNENRSIGEDLLFNLEYLCNVKKMSTVKCSPYIYNLLAEYSLTKKTRPDFFESFTELFKTSSELVERIFGQKDVLPQLETVYFNDILRSLSRLVRDSKSPESKKDTIQTIKKTIEDKFFRQTAAHVEVESKQARIVRKFILTGKFRTIYFFYKIMKMVGKIY